MCGIAAFCGSQSPSIDKMKILGILNETRGTHSNGIFYNGEILKGVGDQKIFTNHIKDILLVPKQDANVCLIHTRSSTYGEHTAENAHPFLIKDRLVIVHNGTIPNAWELAKKYDINTEGIKVDSHVMGMLIEQEGFKILEEYKGKAAFVMYFLDEPENLYIYHGSSRVKPNAAEEEERPLWMMQKEEGIYISSLGYSLNSIRDNEWESAELVPTNEVIRIKEGWQDYEWEFKVNRGDINVEWPVVHKTNHNTGWKGNGFVEGNVVTHYPASVKPLPRPEEKKEKAKNPIWDESYPNKSFEVIQDLVYSHKGRYWKSVNSGAMTTTMICHGKLYLDDRGYICNEDGTAGKPYYFYMGAMMNTFKDYVMVTENEKVKGKLADPEKNFAAVLSSYSKYPLTNLENESLTVTDSLRFAWYKDGRVEKSGFTPKFSNRTYSFNKLGHLREISCDDETEMPLFLDRKNNEELSEAQTNKDEQIAEVGEALEFFRKKWTNTQDIEEALTEVCKRALYNILIDSQERLENKVLTQIEVAQKASSLFDDVVLYENTVEELLPKGEDLETYIEVAIEQLESEKKSSTVVTPPNEQSDDFILHNGIYISKTEFLSNYIVKKDKEEIDISTKRLEDIACKDCGGLGLTGDDKVPCPFCDGTGYDVEKDRPTPPAPTSGNLFSDIEQEGTYGNITEEASNLLTDWVVDIVDDLEHVECSLADLPKSELATEAHDRIKFHSRNLKNFLSRTAIKYSLDQLTSALKAPKGKII